MNIFSDKFHSNDYILLNFSMKSTFCLLVIVLLAAPAQTHAQQEPKTPFTKMYLPVWLEARDHCLDVARAMPVLEAMGSSITHMGPSGAGQATKAVNQVILSGVYLGVAEGMVLAMKSGLDAEKVAGALAGGAAGSWILDNRSGRMIDNEYPLGFRIALHLKDLHIALEMAREVGAALPVSAMASQIEAGLVARGYGDEDNSALARAVRDWSGM